MFVKTGKLKYFSSGKFFCSDKCLQFMDQCFLNVRQGSGVIGDVNENL